MVLGKTELMEPLDVYVHVYVVLIVSIVVQCIKINPMKGFSTEYIDFSATY